MNNKNITEILRKIELNTTNGTVRSECVLWIKRIRDCNLGSAIQVESELQKDIIKKVSIVHNIYEENIKFFGQYYTYPEIKDIILVRKFVELLMNK